MAWVVAALVMATVVTVMAWMVAIVMVAIVMANVVFGGSVRIAIALVMRRAIVALYTFIA